MTCSACGASSYDSNEGCTRCFFNTVGAMLRDTIRRYARFEPWPAMPPGPTLPYNWVGMDGAPLCKNFREHAPGCECGRL